jgi:hypothetical protein
MAIDRSNDKVVEDIQLASREWLEQHPPPVYTDPLNLAERKVRLKSLQESLREAVQATPMVKPKKVSPGKYFFGDFPPPVIASQDPSAHTGAPPRAGEPRARQQLGCEGKTGGSHRLSAYGTSRRRRYSMQSRLTTVS